MSATAVPQPDRPAPPPAPPSPEALARIQAENQALSAQLANRALREAAGAQGGEGGPPAMGVVKNEKGLIVVTGRDGRTFTVDPSAVGDEDAVRELVQTALEPPRVPDPPRRQTSDAVQIVGIVMSTLLLLVIALPLVRGYLRRQSAAAAPAASPELAGRLARIEQAIEAVAIEVERISESERYSARLLTERLPERLPDGARGEGAAGAAYPTQDARR